jgi:signal transduction histidine kinase
MGESSKSRKIPFVLSLLAGLAVVVVCIFGYAGLRGRPGLPRDFDPDRLVRIDNVDIQAPHDAEFALAGKDIGEAAAFYVRTPEGKIEKKMLPVVPFYSGTSYPLIYFVIGLFCLVVGFAVFVLRPGDLKARLFYWLTLVFSLALIIQGDDYCLGRSRLTFIPCLIFILAYALAPALLLRFSFAFSKTPLRLNALFVFAPPLFLAAVQEFVFLYMFLKPSVELERIYYAHFYVFRIYVMLYLLLAIVRMSVSLRKSQEDEERAQIKWIFYGLIVGLLPFLSLFQLPAALSLKPVLSEEFSAVFFIAIPAAFAIAIVKYKLMRIEVVINRSLVYSMLTIFTAGVYILFIEVGQKLLAKVFIVPETVFSVIGVFLAAAAFHPAQKRIQDFVDRAFFRQRYDYRRTVLAFNEKARNIFIRDDLLDCFKREIQGVIPMETVDLRPGGGSGDKGGSEMAIPMKSFSGEIFGFLELGKKKSGERYGREDLELARTMAGDLSVNMERIRLQEEVIYERASREKLDELNNLKTEFIATVSHEIRTPMCSIQGLAEILQSGKVKSEEQKEKYLGLMASESGRLSRFLHNVLDFGGIEQQSKSYHFRETVLQDVIEEALAVFGHILEAGGFRLETRLPDHPVSLAIDADAVKQALINLIDNAIKYSAGGKAIEISLWERDNEIEIRVKDQGIGIPLEEQKKIFDRFYRAHGAGGIDPKGAGLGLKIIKHIMQAHKGDVLVESEVGKGSAFRLIFPRL